MLFPVIKIKKINMCTVICSSFNFFSYCKYISAYYNALYKFMKKNPENPENPQWGTAVMKLKAPPVLGTTGAF